MMNIAGSMRYTMTAIMAVFAASAAIARADEPPVSRAVYLGNEGVMVERGEIRILFDPLFREDFDQYERVPDDIEQALFAGEPPWDNIDAVFVSHYHDDHFDPALMLAYLRAQPAVELYAPAQAADRLRRAARADDQRVIDRVHGLALEREGPPIRLVVPGLLIEAVRIPHAGWPDRMADVENIAFRVTLGGVMTVTHFGDSDPNAAHFEDCHWDERRSDLAMPPYWFFAPVARRVGLLPRLNADRLTGIHVPLEMPDVRSERPAPYRDVDLFTRPGEARKIPARRRVAASDDARRACRGQEY